MTNYDLDDMKNLPVPPARRGAREAAVAAAMQAFKAAQAKSADDTPNARANQQGRQEGRDGSASWRSSGMHRRVLIALAASVTVIALAVPVTLNVLDTRTATNVDPGEAAPAARSNPSLAPPPPDAARAARLTAVSVPPGAVEAGSSPPLAAPAGRSLQVPVAANQKGAHRRRLAELYREPAFDGIARPRPKQGRERISPAAPNPVKSVANEPVSTFSIDVDTASYSFVRRALNQGLLPPKEAVRVEEMINYFPYQYARGATANGVPRGHEPFTTIQTVLPCPWNGANKLLHIHIMGHSAAKRARANVILLTDTSGSMAPDDRLPLLKTAFRMFVAALQPSDTIGIVTYAGVPHVALEPTKITDRDKILRAIDRLDAEGSTAGAAGIQEAYRMAEAAFDKEAVNRIILATDGDFNVGITEVSTLTGFIERKRESGIYLSVLGVGRDNYNDALMQALAQHGNGVATYIDTLNEARKVLVDEASSTVFPIAKDVKIQVEFNPARVAEYRLIGYETRRLGREDFAYDKVNAGVIGSGHSVTAIYEITPVGAPRLVGDLRYGGHVASPRPSQIEPAPAPLASYPVTPPTGDKLAAVARNLASEYAFLKIRYKLPSEETSQSVDVPIDTGLEPSTLDEVNGEVRFSVAVAAFGQLLRGEPYLKTFGFDDVIELARGAKGDDPFGYRAEFIDLVRLAKSARP
jgi:Ca-activated chloride channel family protein